MIFNIAAFILGALCGGVGAAVYLHTHQAKALAAVAEATTAVAGVVAAAKKM